MFKNSLLEIRLTRPMIFSLYDVVKKINDYIPVHMKRIDLTNIQHSVCISIHKECTPRKHCCSC